MKTLKQIFHAGLDGLRDPYFLVEYAMAFEHWPQSTSDLLSDLEQLDCRMVSLKSWTGPTDSWPVDFNFKFLSSARELIKQCLEFRYP